MALSFIRMKHAFNWKRPLFYFLVPIFIFLAFVGFPPPFAPPGVTRPKQEQSVPAQTTKSDQRA